MIVLASFGQDQARRNAFHEGYSDPFLKSPQMSAQNCMVPVQPFCRFSNAAEPGDGVERPQSFKWWKRFSEWGLLPGLDQVVLTVGHSGFPIMVCLSRD